MLTALNTPEIYSLIRGESVPMTKFHCAAVSVGAQGSDRSDAAPGLGPVRALGASWWLLLPVLQIVLGREGCVSIAGVYISIYKRTN